MNIDESVVYFEGETYHLPEMTFGQTGDLYARLQDVVRDYTKVTYTRYFVAMNCIQRINDYWRGIGEK